MRSTGESTPSSTMRLYGTWQPKNTSFFTLIQTKSAGTTIYCHENGVLYHASPSVQLAPETPPYTALLSQWCEDRVKGSSPDLAGTEPRLLIFDALSTGEPRPNLRGAYLRSIEHLLPKPICVVQWAGDVHTLKTFIHTLPHATAGVVAHTRDPLVFARYVGEIQ